MTARVVFHAAAVASALPVDEIARAPDGAWGLVDDQRWLAQPGPDGLELLYLSPADYAHAVRGLPPDEVARVVAHRRRTFAADVPGQALGQVEQRVRGCLCALANDLLGARLREDLLTALASFTTVPRFSDAKLLVLIDYLREGDAEIIAELESPSLHAAGDLDPGGAERAVRRRFASDLGAVGASRGRPELVGVLPYFDVERAYLLTPVTPALEERAHVFHDPTLSWRGGLVMPLPERNLADLEALGHRGVVIFPAPGQLAGAMVGLTPAQLEVELSERLLSPGFAPYLQALRLQQATLRAGARLIAGADAALDEVLTAQLREEAAQLGGWLAVGTTPPPPTRAAENLADAIDAARFLAALSHRRARAGIAGRLEALGRALSHVAEGLRT